MGMYSLRRVLINAYFILLPAFATLQVDAAGKSASFTPHQKDYFWVSEGGNYTFGFKDVGDAAFLLSIWHSEDPNHTAIWWANFGDHDPIVRDGASFNLSNTGILHLYNSSSMLVWNSSSDTSSSTAELQDTGNLRLLKANNQVVWQSFDDRRDSLMLAVAGLDDSMLKNRPLLLQSRRNQSSYAAGRFHLATDESLTLSLYGLDEWNNEFLYFTDVSMNTSDGSVNIGKRYSKRTPVSDRLALDSDGNLRVYRWQSNVTSWGEVWELIYSTKCRVGSPCGPFGICSSSESCSCPPGYHARLAADITQGCTSNTSFNASCGSEGTAYNTTILAVPSTDYYYNDLIMNGVNLDLEQCKTRCLNNCACMAAIYVTSNDRCFLKGNTTLGYLMNGYSTDSDHTLLIKVVTPIEASGASKGAGTKLWLIGVGMAALVVVLGGTLGCAWFLWQRRRGGATSSWIRGENKATDVISGAPAPGPVRFTYQELVEATENFRHPLGEGGFGVVYKGWIREKRVVRRSTREQQPPVLVAVKVMKGSESAEVGKRKKRMRGADQASQGEKQFRAEVNTLGKIHHVNLVSLLGYCAKDGRAGEKLLLVYEYMEKGSLDSFLSAARMQQPLPWPIRYSIALGTARGITYLHDGCSPRILHCDIKPQNVLLDQNFTAKVADFGLAKRFRQRESHLTMSNKCGTRGYMAPEWLKSDEITPKVDVYSFGMLLLELVHGLSTGTDHLPLVEWAVRCISAGVLLPLQASSAAAADDFDDNVRISVLATNSSAGQQDVHSDDNVQRSSVHSTSNNISAGQQDNEQEDKEKL